MKMNKLLFLIIFFTTLGNHVFSQDKILRSKKINIEFSDIDTKDNFEIFLVGESVLKSEFQFVISNGDELLYELSIPSTELIKHNTGVNDEASILKRFDDFLNTNHFIKNPISEDDKYDEDYNYNITEEEWNELKNCKT